MPKIPRRPDEHTLIRRLIALERRIARLERQTGAGSEPDDPAAIDPDDSNDRTT